MMAAEGASRPLQAVALASRARRQPRSSVVGALASLARRSGRPRWWCLSLTTRSRASRGGCGPPGSQVNPSSYVVRGHLAGCWLIFAFVRYGKVGGKLPLLIKVWRKRCP